MELVYNNKKPVGEILAKAESYNCDTDKINTPCLIYGENFDALSLLLKKGFKNKIDLIYIDPPFNTANTFYISEDRKCAISNAKSGEIAYDDNFLLEEYLEFIRERVVLLHELLSDRGSFYFHIDTKMGHYCKVIIDEIFGIQNLKNDITRKKSNPKNFYRKAYGNEKDVILFYAKNQNSNIWNNVKEPISEEEAKGRFTKRDGRGWYTTVPLHAPGETLNGATGQPWRGMMPPAGRHWRYNPSVFDELDSQGLIEWSKTGNPRIKRYAKDSKGKKMQDIWTFKDPQNPDYPTQKNLDLLKRIIMQSSELDSIVLDCFAGGGTTLLAAQQLGRNWIGVDHSAEAINVIKNKMAATPFTEYNLNK